MVQAGLDRREAHQAEAAPSEHSRLPQLGPGVGPAGGGEADLLKEEDRVGLGLSGGLYLVLQYVTVSLHNNKQ